MSKASNRDQLSGTSVAAMKATYPSRSILAPCFPGARRKFTAEEFVSLFLTKPREDALVVKIRTGQFFQDFAQTTLNSKESEHE